jgi:hypothetical protein
MTHTKSAPRQASERKYWTAEKARPELEAWRGSGLSMKAYSRKTGISVRRLSWWKARLADWVEGERPREEGELRLVPMTTPVEVLPPRRGAAMATLRLPGGAALEFDAAEVPAGWVAAVALEATRAR